MTSTVQDSPTRGRPRSLEADAAIRAATLELLTEEGFANLTMAQVASRAGVSTATLYRRWGSKLELVVGILGDTSRELPVPDTGSLEGDLRALFGVLLRKRRDAAGDDRLLAALVGELARHPELARAVRTNLIQPRRRALAEMLSRAEERGDCRLVVDHGLVMDLIFGPINHRALITGEAFTSRTADALVDLVLRAVAPDGPKQGAR